MHIRKQPCGRFFSAMRQLSFSAGLFFLFGFFALPTLYSQSFFYFEYKIPQANIGTQAYYCLLSVFPDGNAAARIRFIVDRYQTDNTIQLSFIDSIPPAKTMLKKGMKYLVPTSISLVAGSQSDFIPPLFEFYKNTETGSDFYEPSGISYNSLGEWVPAEVVENRSYSYPELSKKFVSVFYNPEEPFFQNLFKVETRGFGSNTLKTTLHLLIVANTEDKIIGISSQKDLYHVTSAFTGIAEQLGIPVALTTISGPSYSMKAVENAINNLKPGDNDIVVFYYSGHGYRTLLETTKFPKIVLSNNFNLQTLPSFSLNMDAVYNNIVKKGARLNLVFSDCCNERIEATPAQGHEILTTKSAGLPLNYSTATSLFFSPKKVSILATAADIGQLASGNPSLGGFFSWHFKSALETSTSILRNSATWLQILNEARVNTAKQALTALCGPEKNRCQQYPWFSIQQ